MNDTTKKFLNKIKINAYIYTFLFMAAAGFYIPNRSIGTEVFMFLLAAFAFFTLSKQVNLISRLEAGEDLDTKPKTTVAFRGFVYLVVMLGVLAIIFLLVQAL